MDKFKKFTKQVIESNKLSWQQMCSPMYRNFDMKELREIAKLENIPYYKALSKRELCLELSLYLSKVIVIANKLKNKCINSTTIDLEDIENLPSHKLYPLVHTDNNNKEHMYCFDIEELYKYTKTKKINPYNRQTIPQDELFDIDNAYRKYKVLTEYKSKKEVGIVQPMIPPRNSSRPDPVTPIIPPRSSSRVERINAIERIQDIERSHRSQERREGNYQLLLENMRLSSVRRGSFAQRQREQTIINIMNRNSTDTELLQEDQYGKSLYYYLVLSENRSVITWLLDKSIRPPNNIFDIPDLMYRTQFSAKQSNPTLNTYSLPY